MKDGIIKGTGNSRYLKSAIPSGTTWEQALAMLTSGTFPIDFNGINENGWQQLATALNKANLLSDSTKNSIGLTQADPTVDNALSKLRTLITTAQTTATARARIEVGSYVGTGTYGASNPNSITCSFAPKFIWIFSNNGRSLNYYTSDIASILLLDRIGTNYTNGEGFVQRTGNWSMTSLLARTYCKKSSDGKTVTWYLDTTGIEITGNGPSYAQVNSYNSSYFYIFWG